jgi:type II secretory ATPase GspE/PulE/Tfp pilus assembly ATPase PilB-like protein
MLPSTNPAPEAPQLLADLLIEAETLGVSDIHLQTAPSGLAVAFRLDGILQSVRSIPSESGQRLLGRIKYLARLKTYVDSVPQDGRIEHGEVGTRGDVRVATYPTVTGEKIVLRLFSGARVPVLTDLEMEPTLLDVLQRSLSRPTGLLLFTGPAGAGKTTTIYACVDHLRRLGDRHIITIEDPVETVLDGVMQTEVNEARGLGYATAARHLLRQDPQVLVLGEIRDDETASLAVRAGLTGHLVISTLHAGSTHGVLERLLAMCPDSYSVAAALSLIVNQRLVRKLCKACGGPGCGRCLMTGCSGRIPVAEWLEISEAQRPALRERRLDGLRPSRTIAEAASSLVNRGVISRTEHERVLG